MKLAPDADEILGSLIGRRVEWLVPCIGRGEFMRHRRAALTHH